MAHSSQIHCWLDLAVAGSQLSLVANFNQSVVSTRPHAMAEDKAASWVSLYILGHHVLKCCRPITQLESALQAQIQAALIPRADVKLYSHKNTAFIK